VAVSVFDLFSIGIGPSSSHTVGPMRAAGRFARRLADDGVLAEVTRVSVELCGSLGATGAGHGTPGAVMLGLEGAGPETVDPAEARIRVGEIRADRKLLLAGAHTIPFDPSEDIVLSLRAIDFHSNGMIFLAYGDKGELSRRVYFSVGGGFVVDEEEARSGVREEVVIPYPLSTAAQLVALATQDGCSIAELMARNEAALGRQPDLRAGLLRIWSAFQECVAAGLTATGTLPGALRVRRRARLLAEALEADPSDPLYAMDFLLTAGAIGQLFKANASISGAEVGCQGEVGSACSMAAAGLAAAALQPRWRTPPRSASSTTSG
jgi:L-serine dehydratase